MVACLLAGLAAVPLSAGDIPGFTWKGKPNFPGFARGMTLGPDGNLWLTDADANAIGRVAQDGTVVDDYKLGTYTGFPIPTANAFPVPITAGPDGNLWFVELNNGGKLGRCTTAGIITEFALPGPSGSQWAIASGLDGNVWLSNSPNNGSSVARILKVTPAGQATAFPLPAGVGAGELAAGPDGTMWFIERNATASGIGRITPAGVITDFWLTSKNTVMDITLGQDGHLWFTESNANKIGRITIDGVITEFSIPEVGSYPWGIASGSDGNIWFTEYDAHKLGQLVVSTTTDQGQATFNDSGTWTFYQAVALVPLLPARGTGNVALRRLGSAPTPAAATDATACPPVAVALLTAATGNGNAYEIDAAAPEVCAELGVEHFFTDYFSVRGHGQDRQEIILPVENLGPSPSEDVTFQVVISPSTSDIEVLLARARFQEAPGLSSSFYDCAEEASWSSSNTEFLCVANHVPPDPKGRPTGYLDITLQPPCVEGEVTITACLSAATPDPDPRDNCIHETLTLICTPGQTVQPGDAPVSIPRRGR